MSYLLGETYLGVLQSLSIEIVDKNYQKNEEIEEIGDDLASPLSQELNMDIQLHNDTSYDKRELNISGQNKINTHASGANKKKRNVKLVNISISGLKPVTWQRSTVNHKVSRLVKSNSASGDENVDMFDKEIHLPLLSMCSPSVEVFKQEESRDCSPISNKILLSLFDESEEERHENAEDAVNAEDDYRLTSEKIPSLILGAKFSPEEVNERILSNSLMSSLRKYLPSTIIEQNFWLKYSLLRDGASFYNMLQRVKGSSRTIIAVETVNGEIFGSFTSNIWKNHPMFYGSGESFLWRKITKESSNVEVFPWTDKNYFTQLCRNDIIGLGGGDNIKSLSPKNASNTDSCAGFGLALESDLSRGASVPCATFDNPSLVQSSSDGIFEVYNIEVWTFTRCNTVSDAEELEAHKLFLGTAK